MQDTPTIIAQLHSLLKKASPATKKAMLQTVKESISNDPEDVLTTVPPVSPVMVSPTSPHAPNISSPTTSHPAAVNVADLIEHVPDIGISDVLYKEVISELKSMGLKKKGKGVKTQWLSESSEYYNYTGVINKPKLITTFPGICKLMDLVNAHPSSTSDMDCCLVTCFPSNKASLSLHRDADSVTSQSSAICTVSFGAPRALDFVLDGKKNRDGSMDTTPDWTLPATNRSMNVMKPGSQAHMRHMIRENVGTMLNETINSDFYEGENVRFSLSFRKLATTETIPNIQSTPTQQKNKKKVVLVAGDSFAARLNPDLLGKKKIDVINIACGGRKLSQVKSDIASFVNENTDIVIEKLFVSIGTNDIRSCNKGVGHLKNPLSNLMKDINRLLPNTKVWFQSIPPIHANGCRFTERNVLSMNVLIYDLCAKFHLFYLDIFGAFIDRFGHRNRLLFPKFDESKNIFDIHPNKKGMGILARFYIFLIHSKWFNPLGY